MFRELAIKQRKSFNRRNVAYAKRQETESGDIGNLSKQASKEAQPQAAKRDVAAERLMRKSKSSKLKGS